MHMADIGVALAERGLALSVKKHPTSDRSRRFHASLVNRSGVVQTTSCAGTFDEAVKKVLSRAGISVKCNTRKHRS